MRCYQERKSHVDEAYGTVISSTNPNTAFNRTGMLNYEMIVNIIE